MKGHFDITLLDAGAFTDDDFREALARGEIDELLSKLKVDKKLSRNNLVHHHMCRPLFQFDLSGPDVGFPYYYISGGLASVALLTTDSDPTYTEYQGGYWNFHSPANAAASGSEGSKRFYEDDIDTPQLAVLTGGREGIYFRSRWLYLPYQGVSNNIRSLGIIYCRVGGSSTASTERGQTARVRLKDDEGRNVILNKTNRQVLLVEYEFTLFSI